MFNYSIRCYWFRRLLALITLAVLSVIIGGTNHFPLLAEESVPEDGKNLGYRVSASERVENYNYHSFESLFAEPNGELRQLVSNNSSIAKLVDLGYLTSQGRTIYAVKISDEVATREDENRILIIGGHEAREWISVEIAYLLAKHLIENFCYNPLDTSNCDPLITSIIRNMEIWIVPMLNPDGHNYSTLTQRSWRKNLRDNNISPGSDNCPMASAPVNYQGVNLNRNYAEAWGTTEEDVCVWQDIYRGPSPFSEPETQAIEKLMKENNFVGVLSYQGYSQQILYPWAHPTSQVMQEDAVLIALAQEMSAEIKSVYGENYTPRQAAVYKPTPGNLIDWTYKSFKIPSFNIHLRPTINDPIEFLLPAQEIEPTWLENQPAALHFLTFFNLEIGAPTQERPAFVKSTDPILKFKVRVNGVWQDKDPGDFIVTINESRDGQTTIKHNVVIIGRPVRLETTGLNARNGYEFDVKFPQHLPSGEYDLEVTVGSASVLEEKAVVYGDESAKPGIAVALVIDSSGSMFPDCECPPDNPAPSQDRIAQARKGAKIFVNLMKSGDQVAVIGFGSDAETYLNLTTITSGVTDNRTLAIDAIDRITNLGGTSIGDGLKEALDELENSQSPNKFIVILSDGYDNTPLRIEDIKERVAESQIPVHAIAISNLENIAFRDLSIEGGGYYFSPSDQQLNEVALKEFYQQIFGSVTGQNIVTALTQSVQSGETLETVATIDSSISEATFSVIWGGSDLDLTLETPSARIITPTVAESDPNIEFSSSGTLEFYRIKSPEPGQWIMSTKGVTVDEGGESYTANVTAETGLSADLYLTGSGQNGGKIRVLMNIVDSQPILGATVNTYIQPSTPLPLTTLSLYDDGQHGDELANDGLYANYYTDTIASGGYQFTAKASGVSSTGESFTREMAKSFLVAERPSLAKVIAPPDIEALPGSSLIVTFTVENPGAQEETYDLLFGPVDQAQWADLISVPSTLTIAAGGSVQIPLSINIPPAEQNPISSLLRLAVTNQRNSVWASSATVRIQVPHADLSIAISGPAAVIPSSIVTYTVVYANEASIDVPNVAIVAKLPENIEYIRDSLGNSIPSPNNVRLWFFNSLKASISQSFQIEIRVPKTAEPSTVFSTTLGIISGLTAQGVALAIPDSNVSNNSAIMQTMIVSPSIYLSFNNSGEVNDISFHDEDIVVFNPTTETWAKFFEGADVGVNEDVDGFALLNDGSLLLSFQESINIPGLGEINDSDIVKFIPTSVGNTTAGHFEWYFDGSDVGLTTEGEDIDAVSLTPNGRLMISTKGDVKVDGVPGSDEDLLVFNAITLGADTAGTWEMYFDGSDLDATFVGEDVWDVWIDSTSGDIYLSTDAKVPGKVADEDTINIFVCAPKSLGDNTICSLSLFWTYGLDDKQIDGLSFENILSSTTTFQVGLVGNYNGGEVNDNESAPHTYQVFLPLVNR